MAVLHPIRRIALCQSRSQAAEAGSAETAQWKEPKHHKIPDPSLSQNRATLQYLSPEGLDPGYRWCVARVSGGEGAHDFPYPPP